MGKYLTSGLGVVRNLGKKKIPVVVLSPDKNQLSLYSKYVIGCICPHPRDNPEGYKNFLINIGKELKNKGVLIPISDTDTITLLKYRNELKRYYEFTSANFDIVDKFLDKQKFYKLIKQNKIPHPKTYFVNKTNELDEIKNQINYPCILKPNYSSYFVQDFKKKLLVANSKKELIESYRFIKSKNHDSIIQEIIPGKPEQQCGFNAYYNKKSECIGQIMYRRIREWPHKFGNGCFIESIWEPEFEKIVTKLAKKIKYYGIVDAEFKYDLRDKTYKLIEINPRTWMQNSLPTSYGIDFPYISYCDALNLNLDFYKPVHESKKWIYFPDDFRSALLSIKKNELTFKNYFKSLKGKKVFSVLSKDDPLPVIIFLSQSIYSCLKLN